MPDSNRKTLKEYGRGIIGGLLFSLPMVYTMEVWWTGFIAPPGYLLIYVLVTYLLLLGYNRYAGMKQDSSFSEICWESVEEIGIAFIASFLFLLLIDRIGFGMSLDEIAGKVIVESMIVAIGISVGTAEMGGDNGEGEQSNDEDEQPNEDSNNSVKDAADKNASEQDDFFIKRIILAVCGSVLVASSVAPTDEIMMIALSTDEIQLLLMILASMLITAITVYISDFKGASKSGFSTFTVLWEIIVDYIIALLVSFAALWFFGRVVDQGLSIVIAQVVILGLPATIGASAGRLLIRR